MTHNIIYDVTQIELVAMWQGIHESVLLARRRIHVFVEHRAHIGAPWLVKSSHGPARAPHGGERVRFMEGLVILGRERSRMGEESAAPRDRKRVLAPAPLRAGRIPWRLVAMIRQAWRWVRRQVDVVVEVFAIEDLGALVGLCLMQVNGVEDATALDVPSPQIKGDGHQAYDEEGCACCGATNYGSAIIAAVGR